MICCANKCIINERYIPEHQNKLNIYYLQNYEFFANFFQPKKNSKIRQILKMKKSSKIRILDPRSDVLGSERSTAAARRGRGVGDRRALGRPAERQMQTVLAAASPDDRALPAGQHVDQLLTEAAPGEAVQVEVDGVVRVEQEERDGLERHEDGDQIGVDVGDGDDQSVDGERRRENEPRERDDQQHRGHFGLTLDRRGRLTRAIVEHRLDRVRFIFSAISMQEEQQ